MLGIPGEKLMVDETAAVHHKRRRVGATGGVQRLVVGYVRHRPGDDMAVASREYRRDPIATPYDGAIASLQVPPDGDDSAVALPPGREASGDLRNIEEHGNDGGQGSDNVDP